VTPEAARHTIVVALAIVAAAIGVSIMLVRRTRHRTRMLKERFGPEYERALEQYGSKRGERVLAERVQRVEHMTFRELSDADRARFSSQWTVIQGRFVDDPRAAVAGANDLIKQVMRARGYAADDPFEQRAADLSVDHPDVVQHYRAARALAHGKELDTEELRQAIVHYRALFADLLQPAREAQDSLRPSHA
jgi:hypothetical protein